MDKEIKLMHCEKHNQWFSQDCTGCLCFNCDDTLTKAEAGNFLLDHYAEQTKRGNSVEATVILAMILNFQDRYKVAGLKEKALKVKKPAWCGIDDGDEDD